MANADKRAGHWHKAVYCTDDAEPLWQRCGATSMRLWQQLLVAMETAFVCVPLLHYAFKLAFVSLISRRLFDTNGAGCCGWGWV